jgi:hypothetical protein
VDYHRGMLRQGPDGSYRFLPGIAAFSSGVVAAPGWDIVHATLAAAVPWQDGFVRIERHLRQMGRPRTALCGIELRSPAPFTFDGFATFNEGYRAVLDEWKILVAGENPIPRTNVAPVVAAPSEPSLYAFAYTVQGTTASPSFVVAGAGEMRDRSQGAGGIVRQGDTSPDAMREKARFVMTVMQQRLDALGGAWPRVTAIDVYTAQAFAGLVDEVLGPAGGAAIHGIHWFPSRPPIQGLEFEVDLRGVEREIRL